MFRLALLAVSVSVSVASAAPCALVPNRAVVLTPDGAAIADGGGIVVGQVPDFQRDMPDRGTTDTWKLAGKAPTLHNIAPGLDVIATTGPATVTGSDGKPVATVKHGTPATLDAPKVTGVASVTSQTRHPYTRVDVALGGDPPATAVALVVFDSTGKTAYAWGAVTANAKSLTVFASGGCEQLPQGMRATSPTEQVELAWLDASGRLSKLSAPVTATAGKP